MQAGREGETKETDVWAEQGWCGLELKLGAQGVEKGRLRVCLLT